MPAVHNPALKHPRRPDPNLGLPVEIRLAPYSTSRKCSASPSRIEGEDLIESDFEQGIRAGKNFLHHFGTNRPLDSGFSA